MSAPADERAAPAPARPVWDEAGLAGLAGLNDDALLERAAALPVIRTIVYGRQADRRDYAQATLRCCMKPSGSGPAQLKVRLQPGADSTRRPAQARQ